MMNRNQLDRVDATSKHIKRAADEYDSLANELSATDDSSYDEDVEALRLIADSLHGMVDIIRNGTDGERAKLLDEEGEAPERVR
jgi:hypothetical protein